MATISTPSVPDGVAARIRFYSVAAIAIQFIALSIWGYRYYVIDDRSGPMPGGDFIIFWSAARVALEHGAEFVFSPRWMHPLQVEWWPRDTYSPWPYPPTFLLVVYPLGRLSFPAAMVAFFALGCGAYSAMMAWLTHNQPRWLLLLMLAFPAMAAAIITGQSGLLTVAAAGGALALLPSRPILAGACIAALAIKPQFGVLFPLALICGRQWKAFASAAICTVAFIAITVAVFGTDAWTAFFAFLPTFNSVAIQNSHDLWRGMPTIFALARLSGLSIGAAYAASAVVAAPVAAMVAYLWAKDARFELRAASLAIATLLIQPYFMYYDFAWLAIPIVLIIRDARRLALTRIELLILAAAWTMPALGYFAERGAIPNQFAIPIMLAIPVVILRRHFVRA